VIRTILGMFMVVIWFLSGLLMTTWLEVTHPHWAPGTSLLVAGGGILGTVIATVTAAVWFMRYSD
jgi:hypothetical protein